MGPKRAQGIGSLTERPPGSGKWLWRLRVGTDPVDGSPRRISRTIDAKTRAAAEKKARAFLAEIEASPASGSAAPVSALLNEWFRHSEALGRSPATSYKNRRIIDTVLIPALGDVPIDQLTPRHIDMFATNLLTSSKPVSASTVRRYVAVLSAALNRAVKWGWILKNPVDQATLPKSPHKTVSAPSVEEVQAIIADIQSHNEVHGMAAFLAVSTGLRRGEVCALRWADYVDGKLIVRRSVYKAGKEYGLKSTKTGRERTVPIVGGLEVGLVRWRARCEVLAAQVDVEMSPDAFIVSPWPDGSRILNPDTLSSAFSRSATSLGLSHIHVHSLRHFAATEMLAAGVSAKDAAEVLGHANATMTLNVYAHSTFERQTAAMQALGSVLDS